MAHAGPSQGHAPEAELDADTAETTTLFPVIDRDKVFGLNLTVPEDAKELIKPWNERESTDKYADSGVDDQVCLLNISPSTRPTHALQQPPKLIIHIPFSQNVKIRSMLLKPGQHLSLLSSPFYPSSPLLLIQSTAYPARGELCPHRLRIYSNLPHGLDFDDAENMRPHLDFALLEDVESVTEYPLRVAAFANVNSLTLFFVSLLLSPIGSSVFAQF